MIGVRYPFSGGWIARFQNEQDLLLAVRAMKKSGFEDWDAVAPWPCEATQLASHHASIRLSPKWLSLCGVCGAVLGGAVLCLWIALTQTNDPALVTQGRASGWVSWPAMVPAVFEGVLLGAGLGLVWGFLRGSGLPNWYHWVFEVTQEQRHDERFSQGCFLIAVSESCGECAKNVLEGLKPLSLNFVKCPEERRKK